VSESFDGVAAKIDAGEPLSDHDITELGSSRNIIALGMLATTIRRRVRPNEVTYVRVTDLKLDAAGELVPAAVPEASGEVRIFQTPHTLDAAVTVVENARERAGKIPLSAFCLFELGKLPEGLPVVLPALRKAGLEIVTQAPIDRLAAPEQALEAMTDAGLHLARLTVNETPDREWTAICRHVAALQTKLNMIRAFAPLPRKIDATQPTTGYEDVKRIALSRVLAGNIDTIQVDWSLYGPKLAQVALTFGADDIDSVAADDDASQGKRRSPREEIHRSIRAAGFEPVERDARFNRL
jgi:2-iminoacetate synthase ThiH